MAMTQKRDHMGWMNVFAVTRVLDCDNWIVGGRANKVSVPASIIGVSSRKLPLTLSLGASESHHPPRSVQRDCKGGGEKVDK